MTDSNAAITKSSTTMPFLPPQPTELVAKLSAVPTRKPNVLMPSKSVASFHPNIQSRPAGPPSLKYSSHFAQLIPPESELDDEEDDTDLLKILEKLKDAKKTLDTNKQR